MAERITKAAADLQYGDMLAMPWGGTIRVGDVRAEDSPEGNPVIVVRTGRGDYALAPFMAVVVDA